MSSAAIPEPTKRGKRWVPPHPGGIPRPTSGCANTAFSDASRRSQANANSHPPPRAKPLTAAMTGCCNASIFVATACPRRAKASASSGVMVAISLMSAPAMNARSPPPVSTTHRTAASPSSSRNAWWSALSRSVLRALSLSCWSTMTMATLPCRSTSTAIRLRLQLGQDCTIGGADADVAARDLSQLLLLCLVQAAAHLGRYPHDHRAWLDNHPLRHERPGRDDRARSDRRVGEYRRTHADHDVVANGRAVHDRAVADGDALGDEARRIRVDVEHAVVLDVASGTDPNGRDVAPDGA